jgi:hypothetical protein
MVCQRTKTFTIGATTMANKFHHTMADKVHNLLPHGSGIDDTWQWTKDTKYTIRFDNSFHCMNEDGFYTHWVDFGVVLTICQKYVLNPLKGPSEGMTQIVNKPGDILLDIKCRNNELKDYLYDSHLSDGIDFGGSHPFTAITNAEADELRKTKKTKEFKG